MPNRSWKAGETIAATLAVPWLMTALLAAAPIRLAAQDARGLLTVIYRDDSKLEVRDWHFVYEYLESDAPLDPAYVATCTRPASSGSSCMTQVKTGKDLFIIAPLPGPSAAAQVPFLLPGNTLQALFLHWKESPGPYEADGVTIATTQGARVRISGGLRAPDAFLSNKRHVHLLKLSLAGNVQAQGAPGRFELRLDSLLPSSSLKERVEEIQFQPEPESKRARF
jgi:hypothetical protein